MLRLPVYEVSDGKATTEESVEKGIRNDIHGYERYLLLLLLCFETRKDELLDIGDTASGIRISVGLVLIPREIMVFGALVRRAMIMLIP